ncbi:MAG: CAP domain-containing protein [Anaerolineae bacterium]|nr:CAP domain-containing protein [Anaerolineae bacterium]
MTTFLPRTVPFRLTIALSIVLICTLLAAPAIGQANPNDLIPQLVGQLNVWRLNLGLGPLVYNATLEQMAADQADFLLSLPSIPDNIHAGRNGEGPRDRSQYPQYAWPTFGHPQRIAATEIAAIGNVQTAIQYWQGSDIHNRSVTNPEYREVGIAARKKGTDTLFIVMLGARPGVLPALADIESNLVYLTKDTGQWAGDWIGTPTRFRLLDTRRQPLAEWADWDYNTPLPEGYKDPFFYIEYEDAKGRRTESTVPVLPIWYSGQPLRSLAQGTAVAAIATPTVPAVVQPTVTRPAAAFPTNTPQGGALAFVFATNTPVGQVVQAQSTPAPVISGGSVNLALIYGPRVFTAFPTGAVNLSSLSFRHGQQTFIATAWERQSAGLNVGALSAGNCLQIWQLNSGDQGVPQGCTFVRSIVFQAADRRFWVEGSFEVLAGSQVIATCSATAGRCDVAVP